MSLEPSLAQGSFGSAANRYESYPVGMSTVRHRLPTGWTAAHVAWLILRSSKLALEHFGPTETPSVKVKTAPRVDLDAENVVYAAVPTTA